MTKEELQDRIEKCKVKIEKIEKRIAKWTAGMNDEAKKIAAEGEALYGTLEYTISRLHFNDYKKLHYTDETVYSQDYESNKGPNFDEAFQAYRDLGETKNTLHKYEVKLDELSNFENAEKIEVIWGFLQAWKAQFKAWIIEQCETYNDLKNKFDKAFEEYKKTSEYKDRLDFYSNRGSSSASYYAERDFREQYYTDITELAKGFYNRRTIYDEAALEKFLDKEVKLKYEDLVARITDKSGEILDASGLYISNSGQINGLVTGTKNKVYVETIPAGGYNIQRFHYRTLVKIVS